MYIAPFPVMSNGALQQMFKIIIPNRVYKSITLWNYITLKYYYKAQSLNLSLGALVLPDVNF